MGTGSKKLPPGAMDVVVWVGAGAAFGLVKLLVANAKGSGLACCWVGGDAKLRELKASFIPPNPEDWLC